MDTLSEVYPFLFVVLLLLIYGLSLERVILFRSLFSKIKEANLASSLKKKSEKAKTKKASAEKKDSETEVKGTTSEQA